MHRHDLGVASGQVDRLRARCRARSRPSPGRYDALVKTRGAEIEVEGLMFPEGATQSAPVNVRL